MAAAFDDAWATKDWAHRHFAEGLGYWEANVYTWRCCAGIPSTRALATAKFANSLRTRS